MTDDDRETRGARVRREVLGDAHVDRATATATPFDAPFQDFVTRGAWGTLWADDTLPRRERSLITLALLAATGNFDEIPMHVRATRRTGATPDEIAQAFLHVAVYAGVPAANRAFRIAKAVLAEDGTGDRDMPSTGPAAAP